jgi:competence protein ComGC
MRLKNAGFTLVEVLIMSPILMVTIIITMTLLFNQYGQLTQQGAQVNLNIEAQNITFSMQDDIFFASAFVQTKNDNLTDANQPSGGWAYNSTPPTLILSTAALTTNPRNASRQVVYIDTNGCPSEENSVLYNNVIYFVSGANLYKRTLTAPSGMDTCGDSFQRQTCPAASASSSCPADRILTDKLNSFTLTYYDTNNTVVADPEQAEKVKVELQLKDKAFAEDIYSNSSITLRKLNQ